VVEVIPLLEVEIQGVMILLPIPDTRVNSKPLGENVVKVSCKIIAKVPVEDVEDLVDLVVATIILPIPDIPANNKPLGENVVKVSCKIIAMPLAVDVLVLLPTKLASSTLLL